MDNNHLNGLRTKSPPRIRLSALAVLISATLLTTGASALPPGGGGGDADPDTEAKAYMSHADVSLEEARERLQVQSELPPHIEKLRAQYADRLAFLSIEHRPDQHLLIGLKGYPAEPEQQINVSGTAVRVVFESGLPYTEQEFDQVMSDSHATIITLFPDLTGISGRPELGAIEIFVEGFDTDAYEPAVKEVEAMTHLKVKLIPGRSRTRNLIDL